MKFDTLASVYSIAVWCVISLISIVLLYRTLKVVLGKQKRLPIKKIQKNYFLKTMKVLFGISMILAIISAIYYAYIGSAFKPMISPLLNHLMVLVVVWLALWEIFLSFSISKKMLEKTYKKVIFSIVVLITFTTSVFFTTYIPQMFEFPDEKECLLVELPVEGTWVAGNAGGTELINMHNLVRCQWYAIDMVKVNEEGDFFRNSGNDINDHVCYLAEVRAPVSGRVVAVIDSLDDIQVSLNVRDTANPAGNHVVIEVDKENYLFLAHLHKNSIQVKVDDVVIAGDLIGKVGNSGNTTWPHLHMHLQDLPVLDFKNAKGKPFRFKNIERKRWLNWQSVENAAIIKNDYFRPMQN